MEAPRLSKLWRGGGGLPYAVGGEGALEISLKCKLGNIQMFPLWVCGQGDCRKQAPAKGEGKRRGCSGQCGVEMAFRQQLFRAPKGSSAPAESVAERRGHRGRS